MWDKSEKGIASTTKGYFQRLFSTIDLANGGPVLDSVERFVTPAMNNTLLQNYTTDKVRCALFQMHPFKSPNPDGMSRFFFFQKY